GARQDGKLIAEPVGRKDGSDASADAGGLVTRGIQAHGGAPRPPRPLARPVLPLLARDPSPWIGRLPSQWSRLVPPPPPTGRRRSGGPRQALRPRPVSSARGRSASLCRG